MKIKRPLFSSTRLLGWDCERPNGRFYVQSRAHAWHKTGIECSQASASSRRWPFKTAAAPRDEKWWLPSRNPYKTGCTQNTALK